MERFAYDAEVDYPTYETLRNFAKRKDFELSDVEFDINVRARILSSGRLDGLGEDLGIYTLNLGEPSIVQSLEEISHDSCK